MERKKTLILFAHPAFQKSRVNRVLADTVRALPNVTFHDLYEQYPDLDIDVAREQQLLLEHEVILFQHPFYWYSIPALLKEWQDLVLEYGFAYGEHGTKLSGKVWAQAMTLGGSEQAYTREGHNRFTVRELLAPIDQTAFLCGMHFPPPFLVHDALHQDPVHEIPRHARRYQAFIEALQTTAYVGEEMRTWQDLSPLLGKDALT